MSAETRRDRVVGAHERPSVDPAALDACAREPIHVPGSIQPHGALLVLSEPELSIVRASRSTEAHFGRGAEELLGARLDVLLEPDGLDAVRRALGADHPEDSCVRLVVDGRPFDVTVHRHEGNTFLEAEAHVLEDPREGGDAERRMLGIAARLDDAPDLDALCAIAAREVRALTGFGRVMFYQFEDDDHGWVRAEDRAPGETAYLGLHFPASDIPAQARALYVRNPIRVIPDRAYAPSAIVPDAPPLDLSGAILRSVSPVHLEYLANMGVRASMSISIVRDGRLVALIACHDRAVRHVAPPERAAAQLVGRIVGLHLAGKRAGAGAARRTSTAIALRALRDRLHEVGIERGLVESGPRLLELTGATGAAVVVSGRVTTIGRAPGAADVARIVERLAAEPDDEVHAHDALPARLTEPSPELRAHASGVLAVSIPKPSPDWVLWFRPEIARTVSWAGDPRKPLEGSRDRPQPRRSFELWKQTVEGTARPWEPLDLEIAEQVRRALVKVDLADQIQRERAARANAENAERRVAYLAEASEILARELDVSRVMERVAELAIPRLCEGVVIDLVRGDDVVDRVLVRFEGARDALAQRLRTWRLPGGGPATQVAATGRSILGEVEPEALQRFGVDEEQTRFLRDELGVLRFVGVPLISRDRPIGALFLAHGARRRAFDPHDVELVEELARRAAAAIDNARLYAAAQAATEEAEKAVRVREDLVAVVSHDLKNPVAAIDLEAAHLRRRVQGTESEDPAHVADALERITRATRRMSGLINDLLDVAKIEAGRFVITVGPLDAGALVEDAIEVLRPLAIARGIELTTEIDARGVRVRADRERVFQILSNLVGNALKFTPPGGRIVVAARPAGAEIRFEVTDTGSGIAEAARARIFDRYWQASSAERGRVGLGLFIVRGLAEAHGGRVGVESTVGRGSTFWFTLPIACS